MDPEKRQSGINKGVSGCHHGGPLGVGEMEVTTLESGEG